MKRLTIIYYLLKKAIIFSKLLCKGQKYNYELLQLSHRLEKGLLISNPKPMWGWEKAQRIVDLLPFAESYSSDTANAVLSAYLDSKSNSSYIEDREQFKSFIKKTGYKLVHFESVGGICSIKEPNFNSSELNAINRLFNTRHSCREFSERRVSDVDIQKAIKLALQCPSACNRQPFHVYVIDPTKLALKLGKNHLQYAGDRTLIITGDVRAYNSGELLDWIVSPSIFAGYLTLSLHSLNIGSCVVRKDLVKPSAYNDAVRDLTNMDESEQIVLEMFIGYYKKEFLCPVSNRVNYSDIVTFLN